MEPESTPEVKQPVVPNPQVSLRRCAVFLNAAGLYVDKHPKERSQLTFALTKQAQRVEEKRKKLTADLQAELNEEEIKHASVYADGESKGNLIEKKFDIKTGQDSSKEQTQVRYAYTPEKLKELQKKQRAITESYESKTIDLSPPFKSEPYYVAVPDGLDLKFLDAFTDFVLAPLSEEDEMRVYMAQAAPINGAVKSVIENMKP